MSREAFILDAVRTPRARRKGKFSSVHPVDLSTYPLNEIVNRNKIAPEQINDLAMGCVTQTGEQSWCVARQVILAAGFPISVPGTTINRLCGSGQQAVNFIAMGIQAGHYDLAIGGGVEHMTRCQMFSDVGGEESSLVKKHHPDLVQQGPAAEMMAEEFKLSKETIDEFALGSQMKAKVAQEADRFSKSLVAVPFTTEDGSQDTLAVDDNPRPETTMEGLAGLKTVFKEDGGVVTAGNASAIVDGAGMVLLGTEAKAKELGITPRARIVATSVIGSPPRIMLTGPIEASKQVLARAGLKVDDIDLWEINEAFAPVPLVTINEVGIDPAKVNVNGGAIALGHPLGATGAMLIGTAVDELERAEKKYACVTMCIGLGMGIATVIERV
jgi:acetyl-CoA C-acetyltransferase